MTDQPGRPSLVGELAADFPRDEFSALLRRLPSYGRLAWALARDPRLSRIRRAAVLAAAGYVISPIDVIPGVVPVLGQLDDVFVALTAIRLALDGLKPEWRAERLAAAGLAQADIEADFRATGHITVWLGRSGARLGQGVASGALRVGRNLGGRALVAAQQAQQVARGRRSARSD
jgi:uncharacterized membrane protein YkvA (DUF1232 family)